MEIQKSQQEAQAQMQQKELENREDIQKFQIDLAVTKAIEDRITKLQVAAINASGFSEEKDMDNDGTPDIIEIMDHGLKEQKLALEIKKQADDVRLKEEKLVIDRKKANKPTSNK